MRWKPDRRDTSLDGWPTKALEALSSHEVTLTPLDTTPLFLCILDNQVKNYISQEEC